MSDKNRQIADFVMDEIGGEENVKSLVHCATRLRFVLNDESEVNEDALKDNPNILTAQKSGGQYQVVIGNNVGKVYNEIMNHYDVDGGGDVETEDETESKGILAKVFEYISGTFSPLIPALAGSGMIKALLAVLELFEFWDPASTTALVLQAASNGIFFFFPIFIAISAGNFLKVNPYVAGIIGAALMEPQFTSLIEMGEGLTFLGLPLLAQDYSGSVFPMLVAIAIYAPVERWLKRVVPDTIQLFAVPMLGLLMMVPLTALAFGPFSQYLSGLIANFVQWLLGLSSILTGVVFAAIWPFLVVLGVHWGVTPIMLENMARGGDPLNAMAAGATFAQIGIAFGVYLRYRKNERLRSLSISAVISGLFAGVTEPIIYGLILRYRQLLPIMVITSMIGGAYIGGVGVLQTSYGFNSLLTAPTYTPISQYFIGIAISFSVGAIATYVLGLGEEPYSNVAAKEAADDAVIEEAKEAAFEDESEKVVVATTEQVDQTQQEVLVKPLKGTTIPLAEVDDPVFSSGAMGQGVAVIPSDGKLLAPIDGEVMLLAETKHAIGLRTASGAEILMHIGIDTVELEGRPFTTHVHQGDLVKRGDLLVEFDIDAIETAGKQTVTPILVTNPDIAESVTIHNDAADGDTVITLN